MNLSLKKLKIIENLLKSDFKTFDDEEAKNLLYKVQCEINHIEFQAEIINEIKQNKPTYYAC